MPSTATTRNRLEKQGAGENSNTWGTKLNQALDSVDQALDGMYSTTSASVTLSTTDYASNESRRRFLNVTGGTGTTFTVPNIEKLYLVRNASSGNVVITTGSGTSATVPSGNVMWVVCAGSNLCYAQSLGTMSSITINGQTIDGLTAFGVSLVEAADAAAGRTALGLGAMAEKAKATAAEMWAMTADKGITCDNLDNALEFQAVTYGSTTTVDMSAGVNFRCTLTGSISSLTLSNVIVGKTIELEVIGNDGTNRSVSFHANFDGTTPTITDVTSTRAYALTIKAMTSTRWNVISRTSLS